LLIKSKYAFTLAKKTALCVHIIDFFITKLEPIPSFSNIIGLNICEFSIRGLSLERIYRELRGPPVYNFGTKSFYENVVEIYACSQFHQHFMRAFAPILLRQKNISNLKRTHKKLLAKLWY
jgi:hypothetical protein